MTTLRFMLGVVTADNLELIQLDVKTTFLHGDLQEEIYMEQPKGFVSTGQEHLVYRLRKCLYGLTGTPTVVQEVRLFHPVGRLLKER